MTWPVRLLGEVADTALGKMLDKGKPKGHPHVPYLRNVNVQWGRIDTDDLLTMELSESDRDRFGVQAGDLLVCEGGEIGRCAIWRGRDDYLAYQKALHRVRPSEALDVTYLRYLLEHHAQTGTLATLATGSTIAHLPQQQLRRIPVPLPTIAEQQWIVEALEDHLSRLDAGSSELSVVAQRAKLLLTAGLWAATHNLPTSQSVRLDEISSVRLGRQRSPKNHSGDRMRPYLRAANVDWDRLRLDDVLEMNFTEAEELTYRLRAGDILLTEASGSPREVGKSVLYTGTPNDVCFQNTLLRVRAHGADPEFLQKYLLAEAHAGRFMPEARGVGINHLGRAKLAALKVELPTPEEQAASVAECRRLADRVEALNAAVEIARKRASNLRRALLAAAFSGQLTGHRTDDEVIEELAGAGA